MRLVGTPFGTQLLHKFSLVVDKVVSEHASPSIPRCVASRVSQKTGHGPSNSGRPSASNASCCRHSPQRGCAPSPSACSSGRASRAPCNHSSNPAQPGWSPTLAHCVIRSFISSLASLLISSFPPSAPPLPSKSGVSTNQKCMPMHTRILPS